MPDLKVTADHLKRDAHLYVRQSSLRQVTDHGESTQRQYALKQRAIAAGWAAERIQIIDRDLHETGIVMRLEVSYLVRNSADWHRLIEPCALTATHPRRGRDLRSDRLQ
jgi:DNA invertase Pin-like site-specific DNA recombinase